MSMSVPLPRATILFLTQREREREREQLSQIKGQLKGNLAFYETESVFPSTPSSM